MPCIISEVIEDTIASDLGLMPGDEIISVNGHIINDIIDYRFYTNEEYVEVSMIHNGKPEIFEIEKDYEDDLGIEFEDILFDKLKVCGANCIFCFERQLPKGLRKSLTLRDDDYRLSFYNGNFITLANLKESDIERIIEQRLSPLYVSVHTVDEELREKIIGRKFPPFMETIKRLTDNGICLHTQVVACPGINDGEKLLETINVLGAMYPKILSLAVVPVGLTEHRENLPKINPYTKDEANSVLDLVESKQKEFREKYDTKFVWASDEFYIKAKREIPNNEFYEDYSQIENGIGLVRDFIEWSQEGVEAFNKLKLKNNIKLSFVTGVSFYPYLKSVLDKINNNKLSVNLYEIQNELFGKTVTVTGLLCGRDIINQLKDKDMGDYLMIPEICLNDNNVFLDDLTVEDIEKALNIKVVLEETYLLDTYYAFVEENKK